ncbi:hypothetical protein ACX8Z7_06770 [Glutamicibacter endophyticus]
MELVGQLLDQLNAGGLGSWVMVFVLGGELVLFSAWLVGMISYHVVAGERGDAGMIRHGAAVFVAVILGAVALWGALLGFAYVVVNLV